MRVSWETEWEINPTDIQFEDRRILDADIYMIYYDDLKPDAYKHPQRHKITDPDLITKILESMDQTDVERIISECESDRFGDADNYFLERQVS